MTFICLSIYLFDTKRDQKGIQFRILFHDGTAVYQKFALNIQVVGVFFN